MFTIFEDDIEELIPDGRKSHRGDGGNSRYHRDWFTILKIWVHVGVGGGGWEGAE